MSEDTQHGSAGGAQGGHQFLVPGVELGETIGHGGFATVYRGHQLSVDRQVAVKIDHRRFSDPRNQRRFLRELRAVGRISGHPHVVSLINSGVTSDDRPFLVMELCPNGSLADLLRRTGPLPAVEARRLGLAITGALAAAHEAGILHRDVKPANVLIDAWGTPRLADFGLAALPTSGQELSVTVEALTPVYAAPEAFRNAPPTPRSDVWSMGATLHALISPFQSPRRSADGSPASIEQILHNLATPLPDPEAPGTADLMAVIKRATAYDPADRYADARELHQALAALDLPEVEGAAHLVGGPEATVVVAHVPSVLAEDRSAGATGTGTGAAAGPAKRRALGAAAAALVLGAGLGGVGVWAFTGEDSPSATGSPFAPNLSADPNATSSGSSVPSGQAESPSQSESPSSQKPSGTPTRASFQTPKVGTCWGGLLKANDVITSTETTCADDHAYETFAIGTLEESIATPYLTDVLADPAVKEACTEDAVRAYTGKDDVNRYEFEVIPPRELLFAQGDRGFSCIMRLKEGDFAHKKDPA